MESLCTLEVGVGHVRQAHTHLPGRYLHMRSIGVDVRQLGHTDVVANLEDPLPFRTDSIGAIFSSHCLEHLSMEGARRHLAECYRVLHPERGMFMVFVPDFAWCVEQYQLYGINIQWTGTWIETLIGQQRYPSDFHRSVWDEKSLAYAMKDAGFRWVLSNQRRQASEFCLMGLKGFTGGSTLDLSQ